MGKQKKEACLVKKETDYKGLSVLTSKHSLYLGKMEEI